MSPRFAPVIAASLALLVAAACASPAAPATPAGAPDPTPIAWPSPDPATPKPDAGNVDGIVYPELTIEATDADTIRVAITDPAAKAWRLVVAGAGALAGDWLEILVETGDVGPSITATEVRDGVVVGEMDLSGYVDGTAAAGGCHGTLPVCVDSDGFRLPTDGDGTLAIRLTLVDGGTPLTVTGGTAGWPGEPFILGPWTDTEPFPWGER
ncbi:MAG: hypothetical protein AB1627_16140 [Chloroflexota bacterium]